MRKFCFALDLKDDIALINAYKEYHENIWPEITASIVNSGIKTLEIYCVGNRLFMIMEVGDSFSLEKKSILDAGNLKVQEWEKLMWNYQKSLPFAKKNEKWMLMEKIYQL